MKTVGIIGGLGPETTSEFYMELIFLCQKFNKIHRPEIFISSVPLPYDIEEDAIAKGKGEERCVPFLLEAAKKLERAGADFIVMPCNSLHAFIEEIRNVVKIPVLDIVDETASFLKKKSVTQIGIIATPIILNRKLYEITLKANGIEQITLDSFEQAKIGKMIHNLVLKRYGNKDREKLIETIKNFEKRKVKHIVLACTDLQLLLPHHPRLKIYDTMKILAEATVREIIKD